MEMVRPWKARTNCSKPSLSISTTTFWVILVMYSRSSGRVGSWNSSTLTEEVSSSGTLYTGLTMRMLFCWGLSWAARFFTMRQTILSSRKRWKSLRT